MSLAILATVPLDTFTPEDRESASKAGRALANGSGPVHVEAQAQDGQRQTFVLPAPAVHLVARVLEELGAGRGVSIMPSNAMLTTQQAADLLNVSRPYLIGLLEAGKLAFHKVNTHRKIALQDLNAYREERDHRSRLARDFLVEQAQELDMGY